MSESELIEETPLSVLIEREEFSKQIYKQRTSAFASLVEDIELDENSTVLELGIGPGNHSLFIRDRFGARVVGIDLPRTSTEEDIRSQRSRIEFLTRHGIEYIYGDILNGIPFADSEVDLVILSEVLEHLITAHPPTEFFKDICRVLTSDGYVIVSTPNAAALSNRIKFTLGYNPFDTGFGSGRSYAKHFREYTPAELEYTLETSNIRVDEIYLQEQSTQPSMWAKVISKLRQSGPRSRPVNQTGNSSPALPEPPSWMNLVIRYAQHYIARQRPSFRSTIWVRGRAGGTE